MELNYITDKVIGAAIIIHKKLGPGFLESVYQAALAYELKKKKGLIFNGSARHNFTFAIK